jgi:hypothetical protein
MYRWVDKTEIDGYTTVSFVEWYRNAQPVNNLPSICVFFCVDLSMNRMQACPLKSVTFLLAHKCMLLDELGCGSQLPCVTTK